MTPERFVRLAEIHGGDLKRWPEAERPAAFLLLARTPALRTRLDEARHLDKALLLASRTVAEERAQRVSQSVLERIDHALPVPPPPEWQKPRTLWPAAGLLASMALLGFVVGNIAATGTDSWPELGLSALVSSDTILVSWDQ